MTSTITPATATITITEAITLNGQDKGSTNVQTILLVTEVQQRIVNVPTSEVILLAFAATVPGPGAFNEADVRYIRLTNKDDTNFVQLTFRDEDGTEFATKLDPGHSYIYAGSSGGVVDTMIASGTALTVPSTFADLVDITAVADSAACDVETIVMGV